MSYMVNVTDEQSVAALYAAIDASHGRLDILVNSAGVLGLIDGKRPYVEDMPLTVWQQTIDVNLTGTFLMCRGGIPLMKRQGWGRIINIASRAGRMKTANGNSNYGASKAAVIGFSRVMAGEVGRAGITVNCIAPSRFVTAMTQQVAGSTEYFERSVAETAVGRLATAADVADSIAFLCSDGASFITGSIMDVNGGSFMA
jgi:NAD(P)-dependent dehydrogenase (short-subunit alcohol dehydrogenase family)